MNLCMNLAVTWFSDGTILCLIYFFKWVQQPPAYFIRGLSIDYHNFIQLGHDFIQLLTSD